MNFKNIIDRYFIINFFLKGERRGAAYGIAGLVKGLGILSLKQLDIMSKLTNHIQDKKNYKCREGALFAFEMLCSTLGSKIVLYRRHFRVYKTFYFFSFIYRSLV